MLALDPRTLLHQELETNTSLRSVWEAQRAVTLRGIEERLWQIKGATKELVALALNKWYSENPENVESFADVMTLARWYYELVDARDFERMYQLFSHDIRYKRGGDMIVGLQALRDFYEKKRKIDIRHRLIAQRPIQRGELMDMFMWGEYSGTKDDQPIRGSFVDILSYNSLKQIRERRTCLQRDKRPNESYQILRPLFQVKDDKWDVSVFEAQIHEEDKTQWAIVINQGEKEWIYFDGESGETVR